MASKTSGSDSKGLGQFYQDLSSSPEWASLKIGKKGTSLYIIAIIIGIGLCIGTLSVLLS